jgi:hypothetical protein
MPDHKRNFIAGKIIDLLLEEHTHAAGSTSTRTIELGSWLRRSSTRGRRPSALGGPAS